MNKKWKRVFPPEVTTLMWMNGWLVGSAVDQEEPRDFDILFEPEDWRKVQIILPSLIGDNLSLTRFGGIRFVSKSGVAIDVWCDTLAHFLVCGAQKRTKAYNSNYNKTVICQ